MLMNVILTFIMLSLVEHEKRIELSTAFCNDYSAYRNSVNIAFLRLFLYVQTNRRINIGHKTIVLL